MLPLCKAEDKRLKQKTQALWLNHLINVKHAPLKVYHTAPTLSKAAVNSQAWYEERFSRNKGPLRSCNAVVSRMRNAGLDCRAPGRVKHGHGQKLARECQLCPALSSKHPVSIGAAVNISGVPDGHGSLYKGFGRVNISGKPNGQGSYMRVGRVHIVISKKSPMTTLDMAERAIILIVTTF